MSLETPITDVTLLDGGDVADELKRLATLLRYAEAEFTNGNYQVAIHMLDEANTGYADPLEDNPLAIMERAIRHIEETEENQ